MNPFNNDYIANERAFKYSTERCLPIALMNGFKQMMKIHEACTGDNCKEAVKQLDGFI